MKKNKSFHFFLVYLPLVSIIHPRFLHAHLGSEIPNNELHSKMVGANNSSSSLIKESPKTDVSNNVNLYTMTEKVSDSARLTRMEEEMERLNNKFSLLDSNDKTKMKAIDNILQILTVKQDKGGKLPEDRDIPNMRNEIDEINGRLARIETTVFNNGDNFNRPKRAISPSAKIPCNSQVNCAFDFKSSSHDEEISKPPTSCVDLQKSGHVLSGYYPVKTEEKKIALVFCNFQFSGNFSSTNKGLETMIGSIDIKTKSVHFFVQRNSTMTQSGIIPYELERLNEGGALNMKAGVFTAPVAGVYHFEFSGCKDGSPDYLVVQLLLNGNDISYSAAGKWAGSFNKETTIVKGINVSLRLKKGDRVELTKSGAAALSDYPGYPATQFTGSLLEEDLELA